MNQKSQMFYVNRSGGSIY